MIEHAAHLLAEATSTGTIEGMATGGVLGVVLSYAYKLLGAWLRSRGNGGAAPITPTASDQIEQARLCRTHEAAIASHETEINALKAQQADMRTELRAGLDKIWQAVDGVRQMLSEVLIANARSQTKDGGR